MKNHGFTFIELIIGMTAGAIVAFVAVFLLLPADNWVFIVERRSGVTEAQLAVTHIIREIGRVKSPGHIMAFTPTQFAFVDIDDQDVNIEQFGSNLLLGGDALARNVQTVNFQYLAQDGSQAAAAADIRVVRVTLALTSGTLTIKLESSARIRNGV